MSEYCFAACVGTDSQLAGKAAGCEGCPNQEACATAPKGPDPDLIAIQERMRHIRHKILVLSGKGGVGKSTFSAQLAFALAATGAQVGLLDVDICGPSIPRMLGLEGQDMHSSNAGWSPVYVDDNLGVISIGFMLPDPDDAVIWRGPRKNGIIKQFLKDVDWGELDYLIIDSPPGTSDEHISVAQLLKGCGVDGAVVVTTPQEVSLMDVRKEVNFCKKTGIPVLGVVENMSGLRQRADAIRFMLPRQQAAAAGVNGPGAQVRDVSDSPANGLTDESPTASEATTAHSASGHGGAAGRSSAGESGSCGNARSGSDVGNGVGVSGDQCSGNAAEEVDVTQHVLAALRSVAPELENLVATTDVFYTKGGGGMGLARAMGVPFLGKVPLDPQLSCAAEEGRSAFDADKAGVPAGMSTGALPALRSVIDAILAAVGEGPSQQSK